METSNQKLLKVGDLARRTGKSVRALHLYEEKGNAVSAARARATLAGVR